ncbi:MAG: NAD(P)-binding domain-containing protein [Actinomycetota bacterium]|nr:NAD(P)-binding domain-containing protein [Actinomycetota bacterium]
MAKLDAKPFPPGAYPVVVIGSGPGALQTSYTLRRLGIEHAVVSEDDGPGGMFRRFPLFQRLITWTKPYAIRERGTRGYEWYDWNSLIGESDDERAIVPGLMDGVSYFPTRAEMEQGLVTFAERGGITVRYGCTWESTRRDGEEFVVTTTDGEFRAQAVVVAVGMTKPWKPSIAGLDEVPHYVDVRPVREYAGKRIFVMGKRNSGFEIADALLPWARQIVLGSPRPARISVLAKSTAAARARYLQPYEDHVLGGGNIVLDAAIERVERTAPGYRVFAKGTTMPGDLVLDVDEVIAATGFSTPLLDLPALGVGTFYQGRLPSQTPFWESATLPGIYFAGSITQGAIGLKKFGIPSNSAAVHGFRYNARTLAMHLAEKRFGVRIDRPVVDPKNVVAYLLDEVTKAPELWNQQSYLARALSFNETRGITDEGIVPLAHFVDATGPDSVAVTVETTAEGEIRPAVYVRRGGRVDEHSLAPHPMHDFETADHDAQLSSLLKGLLD